MLTESFVRAMAMVLKPWDFKRENKEGFSLLFSDFSLVQGIWNTVPMLTLEARRYKGSEHPGVNKIPSMFRAAAERKMEPIFVGFTTSSSITIRFLSAIIFAASGSVFLFITQSIPRVRA